MQAIALHLYLKCHSSTGVFSNILLVKTNYLVSSYMEHRSIDWKSPKNNQILSILFIYHSYQSFISYITLSWRRPLSYRNQSIDLRSKSMDWFLYDNGRLHERVKQSNLHWFPLCVISGKSNSSTLLSFIHVLLLITFYHLSLITDAFINNTDTLKWIDYT